MPRCRGTTSPSPCAPDRSAAVPPRGRRGCGSPATWAPGHRRSAARRIRRGPGLGRRVCSPCHTPAYGSDCRSRRSCRSACAGRPWHQSGRRGSDSSLPSTSSSTDGSRTTGDCHVRFCERRGCDSPGDSPGHPWAPAPAHLLRTVGDAAPSMPDDSESRFRFPPAPAKSIGSARAPSTGLTKGDAMVSASIYRALVPDAPLQLRTEGDPETAAFEPRSMAVREARPGLESPSLVSSYAGPIERVLLCFPSQLARKQPRAKAYKSVIKALRPGTRFIVAHNEAARAIVEPWFDETGHPKKNIEFVPLPDYVGLTDWAEDAYVALTEDGESYLMEPWSFLRGGDALIADAVEEYTDVKASSAPLIFQGGNCLIGSDFWLLGKDYFADTINLFAGDRPPVEVGPGDDPRKLATDIFSRYVDAGRRLILVGTRKPIPIAEYVGSEQDGVFYLDIAANGAGSFQPIFHIDMFLTLV